MSNSRAYLCKPPGILFYSLGIEALTPGNRASNQGKQRLYFTQTDLLFCKNREAESEIGWFQGALSVGIPMDKEF